ncbi:unnamed protein product [Absidia cylindrospora]
MVFDAPKRSLELLLWRMVFTADGTLSATGQPKTVVGPTTVKEVTKCAVTATFIPKPQVVLQTCCVILLMVFTGVRPSSIGPPRRCLMDNWNYLCWKDIKIFRTGTDSCGHVLYASVRFRHLKGKSNSISDHNTQPERVMTSSEEQYLDFPAFLVALGITKCVFEVDFTAEIRRDLVFSLSYGRSLRSWWESTFSASRTNMEGIPKLYDLIF